MSIDYDVLGNCVKCHCNLFVQDKDDKGMPMMRLSGSAKEIQFDLSDGSKMRVTICRECKDKHEPKDNSLIMASVIRGWDKSCDEAVADEAKPQFDSKWKEAHMKVYSKKEII